MKTKNRLTNVINNIQWGLILNFISALFSFVIRTLFVRTLGNEYLGLNGLCQSIFNTLNVLDLGLNQAMAYRLYRPLAQGNITEINAQLRLYRKIYFWIGFIIMIASLVILPFLPFFIEGEITVDVNIYVIFMLYIINNVISYWASGYKDLVFIANQKANTTAKMHLISFLIMYIAQIIAVCNYRYYTYTIIQLLGTVLYAIILNYFYRKNYSNFKCFGNLPQDFVKEMYRSTLSLGVYRVRDVLRNTLDSTIVSAVIGLVSLSMYQHYYTILSVPIMIRTTIVNNVVPSLGNYSVLEDKKSVYKVYHMMLFVDLLISGWFAIGFYQLIDDIIIWWLGESYILPQMVVVSFTGYYFILGICDVNRVMRETLGLWNKGKIFAVCETIANIVLSLVFTKLIGMSGVTIATIVCVMFICIPTDWNYIEKEYFGENIKKTLLMTGKFAGWSIISISVISNITNIWNLSYIGNIIIGMILSLIIPGIFFILFFRNNYEFKELINKCAVLIKK